ncbi:transcriptional regulator, TetR family protein [Candidatus Thiomargarita nelsonii]|uniref:Transcriptional regulator, TetR family protein n=1 Tax=Candidatus Thiomargarita nelsonii TaxID=1003181 RepID=A0A176S121_9GAMM|nr:transcriptional regulator, TetR family protein [Candidatus Thiomargarita nelsonii]
MGRRNDHSRQEIREMALQVAEKIVAKEGLQGLNARKIASAIGYSVGSLYIVFENLDDLILQVNARSLDQLYTVISKTEQQCRQPDACLLALGQAYLEFAMEQPQRWRTVFEYQRTKDAEIPSWYRKKIFRLFKLVEKPLLEFMPTLEPHLCAQTARALWGGVHGICILALTGRLEIVGADSVQNLMELLITNYLAGLKNVQGTPCTPEEGTTQECKA